ncbi:hypothetical protein RhiirA1_397845 [Rhizophagus irregularis]|uniref:Protein kinase domain-containing protein n=1 Tax=Rhizophagus irregularis TaxID=588596 RepID=A0A2N0RFT3_9GLOM|nr:hypothetical protein RhiirA1_397845 [Rhizophagus irregularis]
MTKGGYGVIHKATWLSNNETVILKRFENSKNSSNYFLNEIVIISHLMQLLKASFDYISAELELDIDTEGLSSQNLSIKTQNSPTFLKKRNIEELNLETDDDNVALKYAMTNFNSSAVNVNGIRNGITFLCVLQNRGLPT